MHVMHQVVFNSCEVCSLKFLGVKVTRDKITLELFPLVLEQYFFFFLFLADTSFVMSCLVKSIAKEVSKS